MKGSISEEELWWKIKRLEIKSVSDLTSSIKKSISIKKVHTRTTMIIYFRLWHKNHVYGYTERKTHELSFILVYHFSNFDRAFTEGNFLKCSQLASYCEPIGTRSTDLTSLYAVLLVREPSQSQTYLPRSGVMHFYLWATAWPISLTIVKHTFKEANCLLYLHQYTPKVLNVFQWRQTNVTIELEICQTE